MLGRVLHGFQAGEIHGGLDLHREARNGERLQMDRQRRVGGEAAQGVGQTTVVEDRRVDAVCERAQVLERPFGLGAEFVHDLGAGHRIADQELLGEREPDPQQHQALLRAVVEVALDPRTLLVGSLGDPPPRLLELGERRGEPGRDPVVAHGTAHERADRGQRLTVGAQLGVVDQGDDRRTVHVGDERHGAVGPRWRKHPGPAGAVAPAHLAVGHQHLERRVAQALASALRNRGTSAPSLSCSASRASTSPIISRRRTSPARKLMPMPAMLSPQASPRISTASPPRRRAARDEERGEEHDRDGAGKHHRRHRPAAQRGRRAPAARHRHEHAREEQPREPFA